MALLGADIGGTNTRIGIFMGDKTIKVFETKTQDISPYDSLKAAAEWTQKKGIVLVAACIAIAGPIENGKARMVNASYSLSIEDIRKILRIENVSLINDFEAVAFGINALQKGDILPLTKARPIEGAIKAVIGAGTGLGKALLRLDDRLKYYTPLASEDGHSQIPITNEEEFSLLKFIQKTKKREIVYWEDVLSGEGIVTLYEFVESEEGNPMTSKTDSNKKNSGGKQESLIKNKITGAKDKPAMIASFRKTDPSSNKAFDLFSRFLARFLKTTALSALPYGGIYIAGGIVQKNQDILRNKEFKEEWKRSIEWNDLLEKIPIIAIRRSDIGLQGAAFCASKQL